MGSAFDQLCPRYSVTLTPTAPMANRLWETFTFTYIENICDKTGFKILGLVVQSFLSLTSSLRGQPL